MTPTSPEVTAALSGAATRRPGGAQLPGNCNQDGELDISDAICLVGFLFLGAPAVLPCGEGSITDPGNVSLVDWQPDGGIDLSDVISLLSFLFQGGSAHPLAIPGLETRGCVLIEGCETSSGCR